MSTYWQKDDGKCHHCKKELSNNKAMTFMCYDCDEWNSWQSPKYGKIVSFFLWLGRRHW